MHVIVHEYICSLQTHSCVPSAEKDEGGEGEEVEEGGGGGGEEEEEQLMKAFEETQYLIEDLDHANGGWGVACLCLSICLSIYTVYM